jgi:hypothetical protein
VCGVMGVEFGGWISMFAAEDLMGG